MALSHAFISTVVNLTKDEVVGSKLGRPLHLLTGHFAIPLSSNWQNKFIIALNHSEPYIAISDASLPSSGASSQFFQILRRELTNASVENYFIWPNDRIVELVLTNYTPAYELVKRRLIIELIPMQPNLILLDETGKIITLWRRSKSLNVNRPLMVNLMYEPPSYGAVKSMFSKAEAKELETLSEVPNTFNHIYVTNNNVYSVIPLTHLGESKLITVSEFFLTRYEALLARRKKDLYDDVFKVIRRKNKQLKVKVKRQENDLTKAKERLNYNDIGNLLLTYQNEVPKYASQVNLEAIEIKLDNKLNVFENANKYFENHRKAKVAVVKIAEQINKTKAELEYFNNLQSQLLRANESDLKDIKTELNEGGYLSSNNKSPRKKKVKTIYPYITTYDGFEIGYGKNNLQNDHLTFSLARGKDYFFHALNYSGAHVIIFSSDPSKAAIEMAASIALYLSGVSSGEVYIADKKDVKKAPERGKVHILKFETIYLNKLHPDLEKVMHNSKRMS